MIEILENLEKYVQKILEALGLFLFGKYSKLEKNPGCLYFGLPKGRFLEIFRIFIFI